MGGTTAKMCLIKDGQPAMASTFEIARVHRFKRGSGLPVQVRSIELIEIGAGGGSIARVDELGLLKVRAGVGGRRPRPGLLRPRRDAADGDRRRPRARLPQPRRTSSAAACGCRATPPRRRSAAVIAEPMGISVLEAAWGIHQVVNENMTAATRIHVAERGADVRRMRMIAFGGAGPVHADPIARALKMRGYHRPRGAGVTSALGFLTAPTSFELARSVVGPLDGTTARRARRGVRVARGRGPGAARGAGVGADEMRFVRQADLRHAGQGHDIVLELPFATLRGVDVERDVAPLFYDRYESVFGHAHRHLTLEIVTCRVTASGPLPSLTIEAKDAAGVGRGRARCANGARCTSGTPAASSRPRRTSAPC